MGKDKAPAFQFYPSDFLSDGNTMVMSAEEIGMYMLLLCVCWKEGSIPDDMDECAIICRVDVEKFQKSWEKRISKCFVRNEDNELVNPRLEKERLKQQEYRNKKAAAGRKGAKARWQDNDDGNSGAKNNGRYKNGSAKDVPMAKDSSSSSSSSSPSNINSLSIPVRAHLGENDSKKGYEPIIMDPPKSKEEVIKIGAIKAIPPECCEVYFEMRNTDNFLREGNKGWKPIPNWHADLAHCYSKGYLDPEKHKSKRKAKQHGSVNAEEILADTEEMFRED